MANYFCTCRATFALITLLLTVTYATKTQNTIRNHRDQYDGLGRAGAHGGVATVLKSRSSRRSLHGDKDAEAAAQYCREGDFTDLYRTIEQDLAPWKETGFTKSLMDWVLSGFKQYPLRSKGVGVAFVDGTPYIITPPELFNTVGHHKRLITGYLELMLQLAKTFGDQIPNVEFIVTTGDEPSTLLHHYANGTNPERLPPVLRFCKSDASHADILVPDVHFHMRNFTSNLLAHADDFTAQWPWEKKQPMLFGRFSPYKRAVSMRAPELYRSGKKGKNICKTAGPDLWFCDVRKHFIWDWARAANRSGLPVDVAQQPKRDMLYHASNKWLLHLDGQTCSSRLEQLLVLGSLVVKEESGYRAFFHHLIKPYEHYVPFWKKLPEEAEEAINWAKENDAKAAEIAAAAQAVAKRYLHNKALMCYWLTLLQEMFKLQRYRTGPDAGDRKYPTWLPVSDYMEEEGRAELRRHHMDAMEFWR